MARPLRLELAGGLYHNTSRGDGREDIYRADADRNTWLTVLGQVCQRFNWECYAWGSVGAGLYLILQRIGPLIPRGLRPMNP